MDQELVHIGDQNQGVVQYQEVDETGLDDIRLKPSNIILVQNSTRTPGDARPGQFLDTRSMEVYNEVVLVPLKVSTERYMREPGADLDDKPTCHSSDGVVPSPFAQVPQSRLCRTCPQAQWHGQQKSACSLSKRLLAVMKERGVPKYVRFSGKGVGQLNEALQVIKEYITVNDAEIKKSGQGTPLKLYDFFFTVTGEMVNGKFRYAVPRITKIKRVANPGDFGALYEEYVVRRRQDKEEEQAVVSEAQADQAASSVVDAEYVQEV